MVCLLYTISGKSLMTMLQPLHTPCAQGFNYYIHPGSFFDPPMQWDRSASYIPEQAWYPGSIGSCELFRLAIHENKIVKKLKARHSQNLSTSKNQLYDKCSYGNRKCNMYVAIGYMKIVLNSQ